MAQPMEFSVRFAAAVEEFERGEIKPPWNDIAADQFTVEAGRRFDKIVRFRDGDTYGRSVYAFVEREGDFAGAVYKAEGWSKPAKGVRARVDTPEALEATKARFTKYGGWLYR